jgi:hypothetical protein
MSEAGFTGEAISGAAWLEGLSERQKILARLCALKADDAQLLEALARIMECYGPLEKPWCFLAVEALLPPSAFWRTFHQYWQSFEQPPHGRYLWTLGRRRIHWRAEYMAPDDAAAFAALPETLRLYRDQDNRSRVLSPGDCARRRVEDATRTSPPSRRKRPRPRSRASTQPKPKPRSFSSAAGTPPCYDDALI